ncbi:hypothetical protein [Caulobacter hibisci]|uniref:Uncharacterized protein n=1 Tax=Caulobacter hibisci TaxID=2035993 RepID=A0ABS0T2S7_9CAUL|nr:hypothetical protein [Caulobacter hibisci]MBI1685964.1 hypothetical protein [Caulobacter hibisci]
MIWARDYDGEFSQTERVLGWALTFGMAGLFLAGLSWVDSRNDMRLATAVAATPNVVASWRLEAPWGWLTWPVGFTPFFFVPGLFGVMNWRLHPALGRRVRGIVLTLLVLAMGGVLATIAAFSGHQRGVASLDGVVWLKDKQVVARAPWRAATGVNIACRAEGRSNRLKPTYIVRFQGDRSADLSPDWGEPILDWMDRLDNVPNVLASVPTSVDRSDLFECVALHSRGLDEEDRARLKRILGLPADNIDGVG